MSALAFPATARAPLVILFVNAAMAWGMFSLLRLTHAYDPRLLGDSTIAALAPWLGVPILWRRLIQRLGGHLPPWMEATVAPQILLVAGALALLVAWRSTRRPNAHGRAAIAVGALGVSLLLLLIVAHMLLPSPAARGPIITIVTALGLVMAALIIQRLLARQACGSALSRFGSATALTITGAQLLDGFVTYLGVMDPLGLIERPLREQMPVSAFLLETLSIGYVAIKWALALGIVYLFDVKASARRDMDPTTRVALYLVVILVGLQPGLFSATQALS